MITNFHGTVACLRAGLAKWSAFRSDEGGSVAVEYGLIAALVVALSIVALTQLRSSLLNLPFPALFAAFDEALS